jgi:hypothetical protein
VPFEIGVGFGVARVLKFALGFASAIKETVGGGMRFFTLPFAPFALDTKLDDVAHPPELDSNQIVKVRVQLLSYVLLRQIRLYRGNPLHFGFPHRHNSNQSAPTARIVG